MRRSVDHRGDRPVYKQIADDLRDGIRSSELAPGAKLPSQDTLCDIYGVGLNSVRNALALLRSEGLVVTRPQQGSYVRVPGEVVVVKVPNGRRITARMPTEEERRRGGLPEGVPVLVVEDPSGETQVLPGDSTVLETGEPDEG